MIHIVNLCEIKGNDDGKTAFLIFSDASVISAIRPPLFFISSHSWIKIKQK